MMRMEYHGWPDALRLSNGSAEAVIVPAIGRVMQFRFAGEAEDVFWENRALDGARPDPAAPDWANFGGDKSWPAPQDEWGRVTPRAWPPPAAFDAMAVDCEPLSESAVVLTTPVDVHYGIRVVRHVALDPERPVMTVRTCFLKEAGPPVTVSVWVIGQFCHPAGLAVALPERPAMPEGFVTLCGLPQPAGLRRHGRLLLMGRDCARPCKIGTEAESLLWLGQMCACRMETTRSPEQSYPDHGSSGEVYTNPDPLAYIELETLSPLRLLRPGDELAQTTRYTLFRRQEADWQAEARSLLGLAAPA